MAGPTTLTITMIPNSVANSVSVSIPSSLQGLDSTSSGVSQTGYSSADQAIRNIFRAKVFVDNQNRWWSAYQILNITAS